MTKKDREEHFSEKEALLFHAQGKPGKIEISEESVRRGEIKMFPN